MKHRLTALVLLLVAPLAIAEPWEWRTLERDGATALEYALTVPDGLDRTAEVPVLLALPPGPQTRAMVEWCLANYWASEAHRLGWVVVSPAAPDGRPFFAEGADAIPALLDEIDRDFHVETGKVHLAGVSNGGLGAFRVAVRQPDRFASIVVAPGMPGGEREFTDLEALLELPVAFYVGGDDAAWRDGAEKAAARLRELGATDVSVTAFDGEGHVPASLTGELLFQRFESFRGIARAREASRREAGEVLDELHRAASVADGARYFSLFAPDAIFLGTDATERWTVPEFRAYAEPYFSKGKGWTYVPFERHIGLSAAGDVAWFDERLDNAAYGEVRGSGVLRRIGGTYRVAQYNLAFPVPNDLAKDLVERIRAQKGE